MDVTIRPATADDYDAICELLDEVDEIHRRALPHLFCKPDGPVREREEILEWVEGGTDLGMFVAEAAGELVGTVSVRICSAPEERGWVPRCYAEIDPVTVRQSWRRRGVGRALMLRAEEWARERDLDAIEVGVWECNTDAGAFYEALGYRTLVRTLSKSLVDC